MWAKHKEKYCSSDNLIDFKCSGKKSNRQIKLEGLVKSLQWFDSPQLTIWGKFHQPIVKELYLEKLDHFTTVQKYFLQNGLAFGKVYLVGEIETWLQFKVRVQI